MLIQTEVGKAKVVVDEVRLIDGITSADDVTGPYDVIVRAVAGDVDQLGRLGRRPDPGHLAVSPAPSPARSSTSNAPDQSAPRSWTGLTAVPTSARMDVARMDVARMDVPAGGSST